MIAILDGVEAKPLSYFKGGDNSLKCVVLNDDGTDTNLTGLTVNAVFWRKKDRSDTAGAVATIAGALTTPIGGLATFTFTAAEFVFSGNADGTPMWLYIDVLNTGVFVGTSRQGAPVTIK